MRRLVLLSGSALLLSDSTGLNPAFATTGRVAPAVSSSTSTEVAIREVAPATVEEAQIGRAHV